MIRVFLVDDEDLARDRLRRLLETSGMEISIAGESGSPENAASQINSLKPDLVFLDIQMPVLDGFDVVSMLEYPRPYIVFVTAYDQFALKAFEVFALDYLTKPVRLERLKETLSRINLLLKPHPQQESVEKLVQDHQKRKGEIIGLRRGTAVRVMPVRSVLYFEAEEKLVYAHTAEGRFRSDLTLAELEEWLLEKGFSRTHRAFLVKLDCIKELVPWFAGSYQLVLNNGARVPVSRRKVSEIKTLLGI
jgi:DNA-binding LytR/AlgR family response regulator